MVQESLNNNLTYSQGIDVEIIVEVIKFCDVIGNIQWNNVPVFWGSIMKLVIILKVITSPIMETWICTQKCRI